jgi:6-phosphogluconolactonase
LALKREIPSQFLGKKVIVMMLIINDDFDSLMQEAADAYVRLVNQSIRQRGRFSVALSGGSTPDPFYRALADPANQSCINWQKIHLFWGDERPVPPDHPESNFRMVREALIDNVPIPQENIHRVLADIDVRMAAFSYEETLRDLFEGDWPRFDLVLLGMGEDGHTASLFPNSAGLHEEQRWFIANYAPKKDTWRLTLTKNAINAAREIWVLVRGDSKADKLAEVLAGSQDLAKNPIQLVKPVDGELVWWVDAAAAGKLPEDLT